MKDAELSRRDPAAHNALVYQRREEEIRKLRQHVASFPQKSGTSTHPPYSTQSLRCDTALIATGDMLLPPSTAPTAGPLLYAPMAANPSSAVLPSLDQPHFPLPAIDSEAGTGASIPASKHRRSTLVAPRRLSGTPEFTSHDLQNHIEDSITFLSENQTPHLEEVLREAIDNLFGNGSLDGSPINKGWVPKALQKATCEDFQAIISRKCLENKYEQIPDSLQLSYARGLRTFIVKRAKSEEELHRLAAGVKHLLDEESVNPKILLKVLGDKIRHVKPDPPTDVVAGGQIQSEEMVSVQPEQTDGQTKKAIPAAEQNSGHHKSGSGPMSGDNVHKADTKGKRNGSKQKKGGRKRSLLADDEHASKRAKRAPAVTPHFASSESMKKTFENLLSREAARHLKGGS